MKHTRKAKLSDGSCSYCYQNDGHDATNCPLMQTRANQGNVRAKKLMNSFNGGGRLCGFCAEKDHSSTNCPSRFYQFRHSVMIQKNLADSAFAWLHEIGFGPGAMLNGMSRESRYYSNNTKDERIVVINDVVGTNFFHELLYGKQRNWYQVYAIDTANEDVRSIYLPFHPVYAPRPTSMKVQVIQKASEVEIEKMKRHLTCYTNPVMLHETAEDFFAQGYRFKSGNGKLPDIDYAAYNANQNRKSK